MKDLVDRVAVVTGGASGIGRAMASRFATEGMKVVVSDIDAVALDVAVAELRGAGHDAIAVPCDVSRADELRALADATLETYGAVHVMCSNAGVVIGGRVDELTDDEWRWVLDVDLWSAIHGARIFLPLLERQGEGHLIATASTSGLSAAPFIGPYAVAKAGVIGLMECLRRELDERRSPVGASVLCPGPVKTAIVRSHATRPGAVGARSDTAAGRGFQADTGRYLAETGKEPAYVADLVVDAVRTNRFWILTHPEWGDVLRDRTEAMVTTGDLTSRPAPEPASEADADADAAVAPAGAG